MAGFCFLSGRTDISGATEGIHTDSSMVSHKAQCWVLLCSLSICTLLVRSYPHTGFYTMAMPMTLSSFHTFFFLPQTPMFLHGSQHVWQASHHRQRLITQNLIPSNLSYCTSLETHPHVLLVISLDNCHISPSVSAHNLGETTENHLSFLLHIDKLNDWCQFFLCNVRKILVDLCLMPSSTVLAADGEWFEQHETKGRILDVKYRLRPRIRYSKAHNRL